MEERQNLPSQRTRIKPKEPKHYRVVFHNDDFTTMEFVVEVLKTVFFKNDSEAKTLMLAVHTKGKAVVGLYPRDIALSKSQKATRMAKSAGYPLRITCEPDE